jgi:hypothetical protein
MPATGEYPTATDPMKALFGLQTEEQPRIDLEAPVAAPEPIFSAPAPELPSFPAEPAAPVAPAFAEQAFTAAPAAPVAPVYTPEPAFSTEPAYTPEAALAAAPPAPTAVYTPAAAPAGPSAPVPADDDPNAGAQFFGGGVGEWEEPPDLDRTTLSERIALILAFLVPPVGLVVSIVAAVRSARVRGWVHRLLRVAIVVGVIMSIGVGILGAYFYGVLEAARQHDAVAAASTQFCTTVGENPDMISQPTFGFPAPAASVPDTLTSIQEYVDRWDALAKVSPSGIRTDVTRVADAARGILDTITTTRLVNNDENVAVMSSIAQQTNIVGWAQEYCG